jgi:hypothetical protein
MSNDTADMSYLETIHSVAQDDQEIYNEKNWRPKGQVTGRVFCDDLGRASGNQVGLTQLYHQGM